MILQRSNDADTCGVVRDLIQTHSVNAFVWECVNQRAPTDVVVGTWPMNHRGVSGPATDAWRIDLNELKFVHLSVRATCKAINYAGPDEGGDLASWARKRAAK
jgi:hypothetical protein